MSIQTLEAEQLDALVGTRHPVVGFEYPPSGLQPYYQWLMGCLHLLAEASAGELRVAVDTKSPTHVAIAPGKVPLDGAVYAFSGDVVDLAAFNNDVVLLGLALDDTSPTVVLRSEATGWPTSAHIPLARVVVSGGAVTTVTDLRPTARLIGAPGARGLTIESFATSVHGLWPQYGLTLTDQGSVSSPSSVSIQRLSAAGEPLTGSLPVRVRLCEAGQWNLASNATLTATGNTEVVDVLTPDKDLVLLSDSAGVVTADITDGTAETVTLRIGSAPIGGFAVDFSAILNITHS